MTLVPGSPVLCSYLQDSHMAHIHAYKTNTHTHIKKKKCVVGVGRGCGERARAVATCLPPRRRRKDRPGIETSLPVRAAAARAPRGAGGLRAAEGYRVHEHLVSRAAPPAGPPALPPARPPAPRHPAAAAASAAGGAVSLPGARFVPGAAELGGRHGVQHGPGDDPCGFSGMYWY